MGARRLVCPECTKRGVTLRERNNGEDHYGCRYCGWSAYTAVDFESDAQGRNKLAEANPDVSIVNATVERTFYRTVIQVEVLSTEPYDVHKDLDEIAYDITEGSYNGDVQVMTTNERIDGPTTARLLEESGSDPSFFDLDHVGNDLRDY